MLRQTFRTITLACLLVIVLSPIVISVEASSLILTGYNCKAQFANIVGGGSNTLMCRVKNTDVVNTIDGRADFNYHSLGGVTGFVSSGVVSIPPGQTMVLTAQLTVPNACDIFIVTGTLVEASSPLASTTFQFRVTVPPC